MGLRRSLRGDHLGSLVCAVCSFCTQQLNEPPEKHINKRFELGGPPAAAILSRYTLSHYVFSRVLQENRATPPENAPVEV